MLGKLRKSRKGFTLVELLIVVAIIGVLATIGVPTFQRLIQKSKKSEAKVNLGGLFTAESAFRAEFSAYGNNVEGLGFEIDGDAGTLIYLVGFPADGSCDNSAPAAYHPLTSNSYGSAIQSSFPKYYLNGAAAAGATGRNYANCGTGLVNDSGGGIGTIDVAADGSTFIASASGVIAPGIDPNGATNTQMDVWTINENRVLSNVRDGVQ